MGPFLGPKIIFKDVIRQPFDKRLKKDEAEVDHDPGSFGESPITNVDHRQWNGKQ